MGFSDESKVTEMPKAEAESQEYPQCPKCAKEMDETDHRLVRLGNFIGVMVWCKYCKVFLALNITGEIMEKPSGVVGAKGPMIPPFGMNPTRKH